MRTFERLSLEELQLGRQFETEELTLSAEQIIGFATEFDPQAFHTDPEAAEDSIFGGLAASGWHTAALTMKLLVTSGLLDGIVGAGVELAWPTPTRPGDRLHVRATVAAITPSRSKPDRGIVSLDCETLTRDGDVRQRMTARVLAFRR